MRVILICYHKNLTKVYPLHWIGKFRDSILNQTYKDFTIMELNYGGGEERIFDKAEYYESQKMPSFIHAMNYLIEKALAAGADAVANTNVDDSYDIDRLKIQLPFIEQGYDIVTSNFCLVKEDVVFKYHHFDKLSIKEELDRGHNIVAHPSVIYSRQFLENNKYIPSEFPVEDMLLWRRTINHYRFKIVPENLLFHRIHDQSVCQSLNR